MIFWICGVGMGRPSAALFRIAVLLTAALGVYLTCKDGVVSSLVYFTVQSNVLVAVVFAWASWATVRGSGQPPAWLKGGTTLYIAITGLVYNLVLADAPFQMTTGTSGTADLSNQLVHLVVPLAAAADWLLFDEHRRFRWAAAAAWLAYPVGYLGFALVRGALLDGPNRYPYPFLDVDAIGYDGLALNLLVYGGAFWLLGLVLVGVDRALPRNAAPTPEPEPKRVAA
ncbi:Pr6Pr family membrane protein [Saccharopolyspora sp. NPDC000359]|uniref:Pr6Pr family membrane protein n=1 Tax=Saccharopolyspora sp. NPDC000359 TaxID=3154251 RepID=UPI003322015F